MKKMQDKTDRVTAAEADILPPQPAVQPPAKPEEFNGPKGPEPTRFGDWERKGRCVDF